METIAKWTTLCKSKAGFTMHKKVHRPAQQHPPSPPPCPVPKPFPSTSNRHLLNIRVTDMSQPIIRTGSSGSKMVAVVGYHQKRQPWLNRQTGSCMTLPKRSASMRSSHGCFQNALPRTSRNAWRDWAGSRETIQSPAIAAQTRRVLHSTAPSINHKHDLHRPFPLRTYRMIPHSSP